MAGARVADLQRRFAKVKDAARKDAVKAMKEAAEEIAAQMRRAVPVESGALRDSIRVEVDEARMRVKILAGGATTTVKVRTGRKSDKAPMVDYHLFVEYGTRRAKAHPFFWPTWRLMRQRSRGKVTRSITKALKAEAARQGVGDG
jgi:HK97 gp10 family phage protein